jgi:hypothetical protein
VIVRKRANLDPAHRATITWSPHIDALIAP